MNVTFITGNQDKADYLARLLGMELRHQKVDLEEIQSTDLDAIAEHKALQAYEQINTPVLIDDVALEFVALNGLPGPFIKHFVDLPDGNEKLCRMLDGFSDRSATAICTMAYYDGATPKLFKGKLDGVISDHPRGENGFGWDQIFCPNGYGGKTRAELTPSEDNTTYATIKPIADVREFLHSLI